MTDDTAGPCKGSRYLSTLFTTDVKAVQQRQGSRSSYARRDCDPGRPEELSEAERAFIGARDSFYMATAGSGGWPYIQHRGGPPGFVKVLGARSLGFADFSGNRQYISVGNLAGDDRVSLFFMDYPGRARLKLIGRAREADLRADPALAARLIDPGYRARIERAILIEIEAFDWNCSQHITPRFTVAELAPSVDRLKARILELEAEVARITRSA
jgi:hypothetical protein